MHSNIQNKCNSDNHLITDLKRKKKEQEDHGGPVSLLWDPYDFSYFVGRCPIYFMQNISQIGQVVLEKKSLERF